MNNKTKILSFAFLGGLFFILIVTLYFKFSRQQSTTRTTSNTDTEFPDFGKSGLKPDEIIPGKSTITDVVNVLGEPLEKNGNTYTYSSNSPVATNEARFENNTLHFFKEVITIEQERSVSEIVAKYGESSQVLYGAQSSSNINLYTGPEKGIAYLGNLDTDTLIEIWYFEPTTIEQFKENYAQNYYNTPEEAFTSSESTF